MSISIEDLEIFLKHSNEMIGVLDANGIILRANKSWEHTFSRPLDKIIGSHLYELVHKDDIIHYKDLFHKLFIKEQVSHHYFSIVNSKNEWITIDSKILYINNLIYIRGRESTKEEITLQSLQMMSRVAKIAAWNYNVMLKRFYCSLQCARILELSDNKLINLETVFEHYTPEYQKIIRKKFDQLLTKLIPFEYIGKIVTHQGKEKWIDFKAEIISQHADHILVSGIMADVTKEQEYLIMLKHNAETQKMALKGIKSGIFDHNLVTNMVYYSKNFKKMLGMPLDMKQIHDSEFRKKIHPDDEKAANKRHIDGLEEKGHYYFNHYRLQISKGTYQHYEVYAWRKKDKTNNTTIRMIGNLINIEDKIQKQQSISQYQRRIQAVINNGYLYTLLLGRDAELLFVDNRTVAAIIHEFGVDISSNKERFLDIYINNFDTKFKTHFKKALNGKKVVKESSRIEPSGQTVWYEMSYVPIKDSSEVITSILVNFYEITTRKKTELQFKEAKRKTEELSNLKSNILMNISHEIRTPLNGIIGVNGLLSKKISSEERQELLKIQKESSDRLINTLEGMISLSQIDSLNRKISLVPLDVNTLVKECFDEQIPLANSKKLSFELQLFDADLQIMGSHDLFKLSIGHLINNAIKYTNEGAILVHTDVKNNHAKIHIKDSGVGIHKDNLKKIFEMFVQESQGLSRKYEGTGIGLTMAKKYIELMNGKIKVKSKQGKGSSFTVKFPLAQ